jgi:XTP/dITP diphosphohydrolase
MITYAPVTRQVRLVLATRNAHKAAEIARILDGSGVVCESLGAFPGMHEVVEDRDTLEGNAAKKAAETAAHCGTWALADDTGLEVDALGGAPGVYSARWAGPGCTYADNCVKLERALSGVPDGRRAARFRTVMALSSPDGRVESAEGRLEGSIATTPRGTGGFGYDPFFLLPDGRTLAELGVDEKNDISHRGRALRAILPRLRALGAAAACAILLALPAPSRAEKTDEPGQVTIWDQIMAAQAHNELREAGDDLDHRRYDSALHIARHAVSVDPRDPSARMMLGVAQYWTGQVDESIASYRSALELDPTSAQAHLLLGISYGWKGDGEQAEAEFRRATELDPTRSDAEMNLGSVIEGKGDYQGALACFRKALELDRKNALYHFQLGTLYRKLGRDADASDEFREAIKYQPNYEDAMLELGCAQDRLGQTNDAIGTLKQAVDLKPGDAVARMRLARLLDADGQRAKARAILTGAFRLTPEGEGDGLQLSMAYTGGRKPEASDAPQKPEKKPETPAPDPNDPLSVFERNLRRVPLDQSAVLHVDAMFLPRPKLVKEGPGETSSLKRALEQANSGDQQTAAKAVRRDYPLAAADAAGREQQIQKILSDLRQVMQSAPPDSDARLGMNLTYNRASDARSAATAASSPKVIYEPRQVGNDMGLWVIGSGWMALAAEVIPEPGDRPERPDDADWWTTMGLAHATVGEGQHAAEDFARATQLDPRSAAAWLGRGVAAAISGDEAGAVAALKRVLAIDPKNKAAADGIKWLTRPAASAPADASVQGSQ